MKKFTIALTLVAALGVPAAFAATPAPAQAPQGPFAHLGLTDAQKAQIHSIRMAHREQARALRVSLREKRQQLRALRQANDPAAAAARADLRELRHHVRESRHAMRQQVLSVLTPEQRTQLEKMRAKP